MRTWRVGTISMGATLILLGIFLFISQFTKLDHVKVLISWWPVILIILGSEILLYLFFSKQEKSVLKYDFLSILFVGVLGTVGIIFTVMNTTGVLHFFEGAVNQEERTFDLPVFEKQLGNSIKRVVVDVNHYPLTVEGTDQNEVSMFGTYTATVKDGQPPLNDVNDLLLVKEKGDTLYIQLKEIPRPTHHLGYYYQTMDVTFLVPNNVKLEISGNEAAITMKPRELKSNWTIERAYDVALSIEKDSDIKVSLKNVNHVLGMDRNEVAASGQNEEMTVTEESSGDETSSQIDEWIFGSGSSTIQMIQVHQVRIQTTE